MAADDGLKLRVVSQPATEEWCGDCDEENDDSPQESPLNQEGSAMVALEGCEDNEAFAMCKYHVEKHKAAGDFVIEQPSAS